MRGTGTSGSMPFAVIAVTILLLSVSMVAVTAEYQRSSDNTGGVIDDIDAVDEAVRDITDYVNRGLGEIIRLISTDPGIGGLDERVAEFDRRSDEWIDYQFPIVSGGTRATHVSHEISLTAENLGISDPDGVEGYIPTYLKGTGTIEVRISSQSGHGDIGLEVYTDGSYALPLSVDRSTMFESMASGEGVSVSEMMTYQLSALAQYRVLNGYGSTSAYGTLGTDRILTASDVEEAYRICLDAMDTICFRDGDDILTGEGRADLADMLVGNSGSIELDLSAIYAQALFAAMEDILLRWVDYLYGFKIAEGLDSTLFPFRDALDSLYAWLKGEETVSGVLYLREVMTLNGYPEEGYRYPGSGSTTVSAGGFTVTVTNPTADLFSQDWLCDFKHRYDAEDDYVEDFVHDVLRSAALDVASDTNLGTIRIDIDPNDGTTFLESMTSALDDAMLDCERTVQDSITSSLSGHVVYDEFYGRLADEVGSHTDSMVLSSELTSSISSAFSSAIADAKKEAEERDEEYTGPALSDIMSSSAVTMAIAQYRNLVHADLAPIDSLRHVEGEDDNLLKNVLTRICAFGLDGLGVLTPMDDRMDDMVREIVGINGTNPYGGTLELPGGPGFELTDGMGNVMRESLSTEVVADLSATSVSVLEERCMHTTGFREDTSAAYSTVFEVDIAGTVDYIVEGAGSLANAMGTNSSVYRSGFVVDTTIEIVVATGWALAGIEYTPTNTLIGDVWKELLIVLEPVIEPLREVLDAIRGALTALGEAISGAIGFVSEHMVRLYEALMDPMERLREMLEGFVQDVMSEAVFDVMFSIGLGEQSLSFEFFGCMLKFSTDAITWNATTKSVLSVELTMPIAGMVVTAGIDTKVRGEVSKGNLIITGSGGISGDGWSVKAKLDPLMKSSKYLISVDGKVGKNKVSLVAPKLDNYCESGIRLSDIPGLGDIIDNIPLPILGVNIGLDAGFTLRHGSPEKTGLIVNEFESNPQGEDTGNEWVEILNNTTQTIDLSDHTLIVNNGKKDQVTELEGTLSAGEYLVVPMEYTLVNQDEEDTIRILDAEGDTLDRVNMLTDNGNDSRTCQRETDGSLVWELMEGTMGTANGGTGIAGLNVTVLKSCVWNAVVKSFDRVPAITDLDTMARFLEYLVRYTLEEIIDVLAASFIDASVFASIDIKDMTDSASAGFRVAFRTDGDLVEDCLRYLAGQLESILLGMKNPYDIDPLGMFTENIDLEVLFHAGIGMPGIFVDMGLDTPEADMCVIFRTNLAGLTRVLGHDTGRPGFDFGIMFRDCPEGIIPKKLGVKKGLDHDLWLFRAEVTLE